MRVLTNPSLSRRVKTLALSLIVVNMVMFPSKTEFLSLDSVWLTLSYSYTYL